MIDNIAADQVLDCRGLSCPMPMLKVKKAMNALDSGQVLQMMGTDPGTANDIEKGVGKMNCEYLGSENEGDYTNYYIRKE